MGLFYAVLERKDSELSAVEAGGKGVNGKKWSIGRRDRWRRRAHGTDLSVCR